MSKFLFSIQKGASEVADFKKENLSIQNLQHWKKKTFAVVVVVWWLTQSPQERVILGSVPATYNYFRIFCDDLCDMNNFTKE